MLSGPLRTGPVGGRTQAPGSDDAAAGAREPAFFIFLGDEALKARHTDLLFKAQARDGSKRGAFVYLLFEHQSTEQPQMVFRLYCYMANIWRRHMETTKSALPLPPIVSLVLYNGARRRRAARTLHELVEPLGTLAPRIPQFEMVLTDLGACSDELLGLDTSAGRTRLMLKRVPGYAGLPRSRGSGRSSGP